MPKHVFPAAAEGVPAISRRRLLTASAAVVVAVAAPIASAATIAPRDPVLDLIAEERLRYDRYVAAVTPDVSFEDEAVWLKANPDGAGDILYNDPPEILTAAGAAAALRFLIRHDEMDEGETRMLKRVIACLERGQA